MNFELEGRTALVTGASDGIGLATSRALASEGAYVVMCARGRARLESSVSAFGEAAQARVLAVSGDVADIDLPERVYEAAQTAWGRTIDILVFNAGGPPPGAVLVGSDTDWRNAAETTYLALRRFVGSFAPDMRAKAWGRIIAIASATAKEPVAGMAMPATMRAAMVAMIKTLAIEEGRHGITANSILTGGVLTDRFNRLLDIQAEKSGEGREVVQARLAEGVPVGHFATPDEFVHMVSFLASVKSSYVNGAAIAVDGGAMRSAF